MAAPGGEPPAPTPEKKRGSNGGGGAHRRQSSTQAFLASFRVLPEGESAEAGYEGKREAVPDGELSVAFTNKLAASCAKAEGADGVGGWRETCKAAAAVTACCAAYAFVALMFPLNEPFDGIGAGSFLYACPLSGLAVMGGAILYFIALVDAPLGGGMRRVAAASVVGASLTAIVPCIFGFGLDIFPIPYFMITAGSVAAHASLQLVYFGYPKALRKEKRFVRNAMRALFLTAVMMATALSLILYNTVFQRARGDRTTQNLLAVGLPFIKWVIKVFIKKVAIGGENPDFSHGAAYAVEIEVTMLCAIIFTNIESWFTFALIMAMDLCMNLYYVIMITHCVNKDLHQRVKLVAARASTVSIMGGSFAGASPSGVVVDGDVPAFLASCGLAQFADQLKEAGVETMAELGDATLVTDADLSEAGLGKIHVKKLRRALAAPCASPGKSAPEEGTAAVAVSPLKEPALEMQRPHSPRDPVSNPRVAYLCANMYFAEMSEVMGPLIIGAMSCVIYYVVPNDNYRQFTYMDDRMGVTEARFLQGMGYVIVDATTEAIMFAALIYYMRRVLAIDPMRVGWYCVTRHRHYYFLIHVCVGLFFTCMFIRHCGHDTTFEFRWLDKDLVYNATTAQSFLWA